MTTKLKFIILFLLVILSSCSKNDAIELTMFKWNIRETYYLKVSQSDTLFLINKYPMEEGNFYALLDRQEKQSVQQLLDTINFEPRNASFTSSVEDGVTYAFAIKLDGKINTLMMHSRNGPKSYWKLAEYLDSIKKNKQFKFYEKNIHYDDMKEIFMAPPPPKISNGR